MMIALSGRATNLAVAVILAASATAMGATAWANQAAKPKNCSTISGLTDMSYLTVTESASPDLNPGDTIADHDVITDSAGRKIGIGSGSIVLYTDPGDGTMRESFAAWGDFDGGSFFGFVTLSVANAAFGEPINLPVSGIGGGYLGKSGTYQLRLYKRIDSSLSQFTANLTMCG